MNGSIDPDNGLDVRAGVGGRNQAGGPISAVSEFPAQYSSRDWIFLCILSVLGGLLGLRGIYHFGYLGQDFTAHRDLILSFPQGFDYSVPNPPGLYWLGSTIRSLVGDRYYLRVIAQVFLILNTLSLWIIYAFLRYGITSRQLWYAACAFATFVPFRVIHSIVLASDALTLPIFATVAFFTLRLFEDPRNGFSWVGLSFGLTAGIFCKYTFVGLLPPIVLLLTVSFKRKLGRKEWPCWGAIGFLALALPTGAFLLQQHKGRASGPSVTDQHWLPTGAPPVMRWTDILLPQKSDGGVLSSPDFKYGELAAFRKFSYLGLLHVSSFNDIFNFFQPPISPEWTYLEMHLQNQFVRPRSVYSQTLQILAVRWCLIYSILAVAGTFACIVASLQTLFGGKPVVRNQVVVLTSLAVGFYSMIFFSLHRLKDPYAQGYWLPRLVLPALLVFLMLGFIVVDEICGRIGRERRASRIIIAGFGSYTYLACLVFAGFLS